MYRRSDFVKTSYKVGEVASLLNVTVKTIQNWDKAGKLRVNRTATDRREILREDLLDYLEKTGRLKNDAEIDISKRDVIYARVSSNEQKQKGDLDRQSMFLIDNVDDLINPLVLAEVGSGLNDKRKKLHKLIDMVMNNEVNRVFITYKDRLTRFGFEYFKRIFKDKGVDIIIVKDDVENNGVQEELVDDLMGLIASFSGKVYGLMSHKNKKNVKN